MSTPEHPKPLPVFQPDSEWYWQKAREHELWLRACEDCAAKYFYPRDICPACFSRRTTWVRSLGRGTLYTFAIVHRAPHPAFEGDVPYVAAVVEVDGARIPTNLVDVEPDPSQIWIGMPVEVVYEDVTPEVTLPKFRPIRPESR